MSWWRVRVVAFRGGQDGAVLTGSARDQDLAVLQQGHGVAQAGRPESAGRGPLVRGRLTPVGDALCGATVDPGGWLRCGDKGAGAELGPVGSHQGGGRQGHFSTPVEQAGTSCRLGNRGSRHHGAAEASGDWRCTQGAGSGPLDCTRWVQRDHLGLIQDATAVDVAAARLAEPCLTTNDAEPQVAPGSACTKEIHDRWAAFDSALVTLAWKIGAMPMKETTYNHWHEFRLYYFGGQLPDGGTLISNNALQLRDALFGRDAAGKEVTQGLQSCVGKAYFDANCVAAATFAQSASVRLREAFKPFLCMLLGEAKLHRIRVAKLQSDKLSQDALASYTRQASACSKVTVHRLRQRARAEVRARWGGAKARASRGGARRGYR